jgi:hypothetical protein
MIPPVKERADANAVDKLLINPLKNDLKHPFGHDVRAADERPSCMVVSQFSILTPKAPPARLAVV